MSEHEEKEAHGGHGHDDHGHSGSHDAGHGKGGGHSKSSGHGAKAENALIVFINKFLQGIFNTLSSTLRHFVAFSLAMFFLGTLFGAYIQHITSRLAIEPTLLVVAPLLLAVLSYYFTEVAFLIFILLLGVFLLFFL